jgi:hypothetical protein
MSRAKKDAVDIHQEEVRKSTDGGTDANDLEAAHLGVGDLVR